MLTILLHSFLFSNIVFAIYIARFYAIKEVTATFSSLAITQLGYMPASVLMYLYFSSHNRLMLHLLLIMLCINSILIAFGMRRILDDKHTFYNVLPYAVGILLVSLSYFVTVTDWFIIPLAFVLVSSTYFFYSYKLIKKYKGTNIFGFGPAFLYFSMGVFLLTFPLFETMATDIYGYMIFNALIISVGIALNSMYFEFSRETYRVTTHKFEATLNATQTGMIILDGNIIIDANMKALELLGVDDTKSQTIEKFCFPYQEGSISAQQYLANHYSTLKDVSVVSSEWLMVNKTTPVPCEVEISNVVFGDKDYKLFSFVDITSQKQQEDFIHTAKKVFDYAQDAIIMTNPEGEITFVNRSFTTLTGYTNEEALGKKPSIIKSKLHDPQFYETMWTNLLATGSWEGEIYNTRKSKEVIPCYLSLFTIYDKFHKPTKYIGICRDLSAIKRRDELLENLQHYDTLTQLPKRRLLVEYLSKTLEKNDKYIGVIQCTIDNLKHINQEYGHSFGDYVVEWFAKRLSESTRSADFIARSNDNDFMVVNHQLDNIEQLYLYTNQLQNALNKAIEFQDSDVYLTTSFGVTIVEAKDYSVDDVLRQCLTALNSAKDKGRNIIEYYHSVDSESNASLAIESKIYQAIENDEFLPYFQAKVDPYTHEIIGFEALARWIDKEGNFIPPNQFIHVAERLGIIVDISEIIIRKTCSFINELVENGYPITGSINLSPVQFSRGNPVECISHIFDEINVDPNLVEFEITESSLVNMDDALINTLEKIKTLGCSLSLDDFGTGYSSLSYLNNLPFDIVKIDRQFVIELPKGEKEYNLFNAIVTMCHSLDIKVVAEGVEEDEQLSLIKKTKCDYIQGYYYSKPLSDGEFYKLIKNWK